MWTPTLSGHTVLSVCIRGATLCTCLQIASFPGSPQKRFYFSSERGESLGTKLMYRCQWEYVPQPNVTWNKVSAFHSKAPLLIDDLLPTGKIYITTDWLDLWPLTFDTLQMMMRRWWGSGLVSQLMTGAARGPDSTVLGYSESLSFSSSILPALPSSSLSFLSFCFGMLFCS